MYYKKIIAHPIMTVEPMPSINVEIETPKENEQEADPIATLLQVALIGEYQQWDLYTAYASRLKGAARSPVAEEFTAHADEEQGHIDLLQRYLVSMGVNPTLERKPVPELSEGATMKEIIDLQLRFERDAVSLYERILNVLPENEPLKLEIEGVLIKEQEHVHDLELLLDQESVVAKAKRIPKKGDIDFHQHKIALDTLQNPKKVLLGGPSLKEAKDMLKKHFGYTDKDLEKFEVSSCYFRHEEPGEPTKPQAGYGQGCGCGPGCNCPQSFLFKVDQKWCAQALKELSPDIYARWYQGKLLTAQEKAFVAQAITLKWNLRDQRAILRFLDSSKV